MSTPKDGNNPRGELSDAKRALLEKRLGGQNKRIGTERIPRIADSGRIPLSFAQERLWFLHQLDPLNPAYNMYNVVRLQGKVDTKLLEECFQVLIGRHDVLRTCFVMHDDQPFQKVASSISFHIPVKDIKSSGIREQKEEAQHLITTEICQPFDLTQSPLFRVLLLKQSESEHFLVVTIHHIIFDEWSNEIFWKEFSQIYNALTKGEQPDLPDLDIQYKDYSFWQKNQVEQLMTEQLDFWKEELKGNLPFIELPLDHPRPVKQAFRGAFLWRELSPDIYTKLLSLNHELGTTMFMILVAAYQVLLSRLSGQDDILVGTPIANRTRNETKDLIGFFLNTLVLRGDLSSNLPFVEFASQVRNKALSAYSNQDLPFEKLVDELRPNRDMSHNPIFQVMFVHQRSALEMIELSGLIAEEVPVDIGVSKFDLTMFVEESRGRLNVGLEYNTDLFEEDTANRILDCYQTLIESILRDPHQPIEQLEILPEDERFKILHEWNDTDAGPVPDTTIHQLIEAQSETRPDDIAVTDLNNVLSYGVLNKQSNQLANFLQHYGVAANVPVGILLERSTQMALAILAVLKAGGAYLPLDPAYPRERLAYMLDDSKTTVLITTGEFAEHLNEFVGKVILLDKAWSQISQEEDSNLEDAVSPENFAYIIYTSGSTGKPRGVAVSHSNLIHSTIARNHFYSDPPESFLLLSSFTFDSSIAGIFWTLCSGGKLVLPPQRIEQDMRQLAEIIADQQITHTLCLPSLYMLLLDLVEPNKLSSLQTVIVAGEACLPELVQVHFERLPGPGLYNEYGPTEATVWSTALRIEPKHSEQAVPIGRPIPNTQNYILDRRNQPVPVGVTGELCVGGPGVTAGYLNDRQTTARKFIELTLDGDQLIRIYKTGDRARYLPDGNIEFLGRIDQQVKIRGNRVELGEIESTLVKMPAVKDAIVIAKDDRLSAYIIQDSSGSLPKNWRSHLINYLPNYMIPSNFFILEEFPLTPNGKVDRNALPELPDQALGETFVPPTSDVEKKLVEIWKEVLDVDRVGVQDNFFDMGGDSILSIRILAKANQVGIKLTPFDLFQHQTIAQLAPVVKLGKTIEADQKLIDGEVPLTPIQQWFFEQDLQEPDWWNQSVLLECEEPLNLEHLNQAINSLIQHHDMLRAQFNLVSGYWVQTIEANSRVFSLETYTIPPESEEVKFIEHRIVELLSKTSISSGVMVQGAWFLGNGRNYLFLTIHHLAVDSVSWEVLLKDLESAYFQLVAGNKVTFPAKTTSFKQWSEQLAEYQPSVDQVVFWKKVAQGAQSLPVDGTFSSNLVQESSTLTLKLNPETTLSLMQDVPSIYRTRINEALLTALVDSFHKWRELDDLLVALEGHGREILFENVDLSRTVGWFTTVHPLRLQRVSGDLGQRFRTIKEQIRAVPQNGIGYGLFRYSGEERIREEISDLSLPQILFNYLGRYEKEEGLFHQVPLSLATLHGPNNERPYLIEINARVINNELEINWTYNPNIHRTETIQQLASNYIHSLGELVEWCRTAPPSFTPSDFDLLEVDQLELDRITERYLQLDTPQGEIPESRMGNLSSPNLGNIIDILPLTEMQALMLLHSKSVRGNDVLFNQFGYVIEGQIDPIAFEKAWAQIIQRHTILRSIFLWDGLLNPVQVVHKHVANPFNYLDWRNQTAAVQEELYQNILREDQEKGFDLTSAPLMRLSLARINDDRWLFIWSNHHLILDRWCMSIIMEELHQLYAANRDNTLISLSAPVPYRNYVAYTLKQDEKLAEAYWREMLDGITQPTILDSSGEGDGQGHESLSFPVQSTIELQKFIKQQRLTMSSVLQGSLALLMSSYASENSIVYGLTVSGRPPDLPGVSEMLGSLINNLPFPIDCPPEHNLFDWLQSIQERQQSMQSFQHYSPFKIQGWSSISNNLPLFEILFLYQAPLDKHYESMVIEQVDDGLQTNYPLTLVSELTPDGELQLDAFFDRKRFNTPYINKFLVDWITITNAILSDPSQPLSHYSMVIEPPKREIHQVKPASHKIQYPGEQPRNKAQEKLVAIWEELLEVPSVGVYDDFFDIGGSSLTAMHMFARIAEDMDVKLPLSVLFTHSTIEKLAIYINSEKGLDEDWSLLVPIQTDGKKPPFFCVHGLTGDILWFRQLGQLMAPDQPFFGIQARGLDSEADPIDSIEEMAAVYIREIMGMQNNGPYFLGGASLGGTVALEMAQQLERLGQEVAILVMFDHPPNYPLLEKTSFVRWISGSVEIIRNFPYWLSSISEIGTSGIIQRVRRKLRIVSKRSSFWNSIEKTDGIDAGDLLDYGSELPLYRQRMIEAHWFAINNYIVKPYDGRVLLLQAKSQPLFSTSKPENTWRHLAKGDLTIINIPGSHEGMFHEPHVRTLAHELRSQLAVVQRN